MNELQPIEFCEETINLKKTLESGFIILGERLSRIEREQLWRGQWENFSEFCMEMDINKATASRLMTVYKTYVEKFGITTDELSGRSWYNLYELRKVIPENATKKEVFELVESTQDFSREEINKLIRENNHTGCKHLNMYEVHLRQCRDCGYREIID